MILKEREYRIRGGEATEENLTIHLRENLKFTFGIYQRALQMPVDNLVGGVGFEKLLKAQAVRNRLTHPKCVADLEVPDEALEQAEEGSAWYFDIIDLLLDRSSVESIYYRSFGSAPEEVVEMVEKLLGAGAILQVGESSVPVGMMKQIGRYDWFYWGIDYDITHSGSTLKARAFATSDEQGLLVGWQKAGAKAF